MGARSGRGLFVELELLPHQEKVGQQTEGHVVMPADPAASFVVPQSQQLRACLQAGFDRPAHGRQPHQLRHGHVRRTLYQIGFELGGARRAAQQQPDIGTGLGPPGSDHAQRRKVGAQGPLTAFLQLQVAPCTGGHLRGHLLDRLRTGRAGGQPQTGGGPSRHGRGRHTHLWPRRPDPGGVRHLGTIAQAQGRQPIQEDRIGAVALITGHPPHRQAASRHDLCHQGGGDLGFGLEGDALWHPAAVPPRRPGRILYLAAGQIQLPMDQGGPRATGIGEKDARLAVGSLAQLPAVLARHAHRLPPLLAEVAAVHDQHAHGMPLDKGIRTNMLVINPLMLRQDG